MKERPKTTIRRRDLFGLALASAGASVAAAVTVEPVVAAKSIDLKDKRRPRYQPNSAEVRNFYRVNSYPTR
jgi:hypothetical protein